MQADEIDDGTAMDFFACFQTEVSMTLVAPQKLRVCACVRACMWATWDDAALLLVLARLIHVFPHPTSCTPTSCEATFHGSATTVNRCTL